MGDESLDKCQEKAKESMLKRLGELVLKGGKPAYNAFVSTVNSFIDTLSTLAGAVVAVIEPIITIDKFVFDNFIKPQAETILSTAKQIRDVVKIPAQAIGAASNDCPGGRQNAEAIKKISEQGTKGMDRLVNSVEKYEYDTERRNRVLQALKKLPDYVDKLKITSTYEEFIVYLGLA